MTLQKIAKEANVSVSTVSKALNGSKEISFETAEKILEIAIKHGYYNSKRKLKKEYNKTPIFNIAVFCPEIISIHYSSVVTCLCEKIEKLGGKGFVQITGFDDETEISAASKLISDTGMSAVISFSSVNYDDNFPLPVLKLSKSDKYDCVYSDMEQGIYDMIKHLKSCGHKKIGYIGEKLTNDKLNDFEKALKRLNLKKMMIIFQ